MTPADFRRIAMTMPGAEEVRQRVHSEFRVVRKIFATLEQSADFVAVIRFTPDQQAMFVEGAPSVFAPVLGREGRLGRTFVWLYAADEKLIEDALITAWSNVAPKPPSGYKKVKE